MSNIRRYYNKGNIYFVTIVTYNRRPILIEHIDLLKDSIKTVYSKLQFRLIAYVFLPDHFHLIIDPKDSNLSSIIQRIKMSFTMKYIKEKRKTNGRVWQYRFWDHIIRDETDSNTYINYIHYNPVKHSHADTPLKWKYSSFHKYLEKGLYENNWGKRSLDFNGDFGE